MNKHDIKHFQDLLSDALYYDKFFTEKFCEDCHMQAPKGYELECTPYDTSCIRGHVWYHVMEACNQCARDVLTALADK